MNIKKTQEFIYFQNKARHYANLRNMKSTVKTTRNKHNYSTLDQYAKKPYFQRYDMERNNEGLINRLTDIFSQQKPEVYKQGYTRYNHQFVPKSHLLIQQKKTEAQIDQQNTILAYKVMKSKPSVGTIENWHTRYHELRERKKIISKYSQDKPSKAILDIYSSTTFIPQHYKSFLNKSLSKKTQDNPQIIQEAPMTMRVRVEHLFQLPKLKRMRGSLTKIHED